MAIIGETSTINMVIDLVAVVAIILVFYLQGKLNDFKKFGYLVQILTDCQKAQKPLGFIVDQSGTMIPFVAENDKERPGTVKNPGKFVLITPDLVKPSERMELFKGPKVLMYPLPHFFPQSLHSAASLNQLAQRIHEHPRLSKFKNDVKMIELITNVTSTFQRDCDTFVRSMIGKVKIPNEYLPIVEVEEEVKQTKEPEKPEEIIQEVEKQGEPEQEEPEEQEESEEQEEESIAARMRGSRRLRR